MALVCGGLGDRLGSVVELTEAEKAALGSLEAETRRAPRGTTLQREREDAAGMWVLRSGWVASALALRDGGRQIIQVHLPGDLIGLTALAGGMAGETVSTLTEAVVAPVGREALGQLIERHPRLCALILVQSQVERQRIGDRMAAIGRTDARTRLACLLVDLIDRQRACGLAASGKLPLPMTQEEIGDTLGLTAVHVNRMMRVLADEGLIARAAGGQLGLLDEPRLRRFAGYCDRDGPGDLGWLPLARTG